MYRSKSINEFYKIDNNVRQPGSCNPPTCYSASDLPKTLNITEEDFYNVFFFDKNTGEFIAPRLLTIDYYFSAVEYNNTSVIQYAKNHSSEVVTINDDHVPPSPVKVAKMFHFGEPFCNLL